MSQNKTRARKAKKKRWKQHEDAGSMRGGGVAGHDPSTRVTGPLATIVGLSVVAIVIGVLALVVVNVAS